jgi:hypothetical protein
MSSKLNSEFNYRTQVIGETPWEKIKTIKGFLVGRKRALALQECNRLKMRALALEIEYLEKNGGPEHVILQKKAEQLEQESVQEDLAESFELTKQEIKFLEDYLQELYAIVEPTRLEGYTDEQMFELNAANEFTVWVARELHAEILAMGHPSPAKVRNAMSCPQAWEACKAIGLIPENALVIEGNTNPLNISLSQPLLVEKQDVET